MGRGRVAGGARRLECVAHDIARLRSQTRARAVHPMGELGAATILETLQGLPLGELGQIRRQLRQKLYVLFSASQRVAAEVRADGEERLRQRMAALGGRDTGPEQIDEPVAGDGTRASLEMEVEQHGEVFPGAEANGASAPLNELGGTENVEPKPSSHNVLRLG